MSKCKQCGSCCKAIRLGFSDLGELSEMLTLIPKEEAFNIKPNLKKYHTEGANYYNCNKLINNKCTIHENKPGMCKEYPDPHGGSIVSTDCGYYNEENLLDDILFNMLA